MTQASASQALADFLTRTTWPSLSAKVRHETRRTLFNGIGAALGAAADAAVTQAARALDPFSGPRDATVIGASKRLDVMGASFVNAIACNLLDYDDTHLRTVIHPAAPVVPPVLAMAERLGSSGQDALLAVALGIEVACRIGNAVSPGHYDRGWHITSSCGVFGAAAAVSKLLGLDARGCAAALGVAASQSAGIVENLPSAAKNVSVGSAARNGLLAALLAQQGYEAAPRAIEGPLGWARACGDVPVLDEIVGGLGERWELLANTYKPYPCGIVMHAVIDACLALRTVPGLDTGAIRSVRVSGDALLLARGDRPVRNERDARVSIQHCAAVSLLRGRAGVEEFEAACVNEPQVEALRARISAELDDTLPRGAARVSVITRGGERHAHTVTIARGSRETPLSDAEIEAKLRALAARSAGHMGDLELLVHGLWHIDELAQLRDLMRLMAPAGG